MSDKSSIESETKYNTYEHDKNNGNESCTGNDIVLGTMILQKYETLQNESRNYKYKILRLRRRVYELEMGIKKLESENSMLKKSQTIKWISIAINVGFVAYITKLYVSR